jgi:hypothetical protein
MDVVFIETSLSAALKILLDHRAICGEAAEFTDLLYHDSFWFHGCSLPSISIAYSVVASRGTLRPCS